MALNFKKYLKDKDRRRGVIGTTIIHLILLFALFFLALRTPLPLPGEEGVEVNLGYDETGYGDIQSESAPPESQPTPPSQQQQVEQNEPEPEMIEPEPEITEPEPEIAEEEIITQDIEEAPAIEEEIIEEKKEEEKEPVKEEPEEIKEEKEPEPVKEEPVEEPKEEVTDSTFVAESEEVTEEVVEEPKPVVNQRALYPGTSKNKSGTNEGNTQGAGDMGKPTGYKDSEGYDGKGGKGDGISWGLEGRGKLHLEVPSDDFEERGDIKVGILVNREGQVIKAWIDYSGTEPMMSDKQKQQAIDAAMNSKFEKKSDAPEQQRGWITYTYIK